MILSPKELRLTDKFNYENISPTVKITSKTLKDTHLNQAGYSSANKSFPYEVHLNIKFHEL